MRLVTAGPVLPRSWTRSQQPLGHAHLEQLVPAGCQAVVAEHVESRQPGGPCVKELANVPQVGRAPGRVPRPPIHDVTQGHQER
jgi:hypothetical protein